MTIHSLPDHEDEREERSVTIRRRRRPRDYTDLPNQLIQDVRLSWKALGLLVYLLHLPDDWRLNLSHLSSRRGQHGTRRTATTSAVRELQETGYLKIIHEREQGKFSSTTWLVSDEPEFEPPPPPRQEPTSPQSDFPTAANPTPENQTLQTKKFTNKELNEAAAPRASARQAAASAAANSRGKQFRLRPSGLVTWTMEDVSAAEKIEQDFPLSSIKEAVRQITRAKKDPLPGLVLRQLAQSLHEQEDSSAHSALAAFLGGLVKVEGINRPVRITRISNSYYGELEGGRGGVPHGELIRLALTGKILPWLPEDVAAAAAPEQLESSAKSSSQTVRNALAQMQLIMSPLNHP